MGCLDETLYAPDSKWLSENPFALELSYLMNFKGEKLPIARSKRYVVKVLRMS
jgi:hypothetical protein